METIKYSLKLYVERKIPTGSFLEAVLSNDLFDAVGRADSTNIKQLDKIVKYIYNELPSNCWGSRETVREWLNSK